MEYAEFVRRAFNFIKEINMRSLTWGFVFICLNGVTFAQSPAQQVIIPGYMEPSSNAMQVPPAQSGPETQPYPPPQGSGNGGTDSAVLMQGAKPLSTSNVSPETQVPPSEPPQSPLPNSPNIGDMPNQPPGM